MNTMLRRPPRTLTVPEFLEWCPDDGRKWQLFDGEPRAMAPSKTRQGMIQAELAAVIRNHLLAIGSPCVAVTEPGVIPRINAAKNFRIPDLAVTCIGEAEEETTVSEPVLLVEILSMSNVRETTANVWAYTSIPSIREILTLRTMRIEAAILRRRADGSWPENPDIVTEGDLALDSIGFRAPLAGLYRTTRLTR